MKTQVFNFRTFIYLVGVLLFVNSCKLSETTVNDGENSDVSKYTEHLITIDQANLLSQTYANGNYLKINAKKQSLDAKEVYYDLNSLLSYFDYVNTEAKKKNVENPKIRVVFAQYPSENLLDDRESPDLKGQQTVYFQAKAGSGASLDVMGISNLEFISGNTSFRNCTISKEQENLFSQEYKNKNGAVINSINGFEDTTEVSYDLSVLQSYLNHVKEVADSQNQKNIKIKINFGQYPSDNLIDTREDPIYKGHQMLYFSAVSQKQATQISKGESVTTLDAAGLLDYGSLSPPN